KLGVGPIPSSSSKPVKNGGVFIGGAGLYIVKKSAATQDAAGQFIKYLTKPAQQAAWASATGYVPVRKSATSLAPLVATWAKVPGYRVPYSQLLASPTTPATAGYVAGPANQIDQSILNALESLSSGTSPKKAIAQAAAAANSAISSYNQR